MYDLLIVDDEITVRTGLKKIIPWENLGFAVAGDFGSAVEALAFLENNKADVVLTDIIMPKVNGLEMIEKITGIHPEILTVILSGHGEFHYAKRAIQLGVTDFLTKPVDFDELKMIFSKIKIKLDEAYSTSVKQEVLEANSSGFLLGNIKKYIDEHYNEEISLKKLSSIFYVHPNHIGKLFREKSGENFIDYLTRVRIEKAKLLLRDFTLKIFEVSEIAGFCNARYFGITFKQLVGMTPREFRDTIK